MRSGYQTSPWLALLCICAASASAQDSVPWPAQNQLEVTVETGATILPDDTVRLTYVITNAPTSQQAAAHFVVRTYVTQYRLGAPAHWVSSSGSVQDSAAALWGAVFGQPEVQPGKSQGGFSFIARGLPDIVPYRVQGYSPPPTYDDTKPWVFKKAPSIWTNSVRGFTVGIAPLPGNLHAAQLAQRLTDLGSESCELGWIRQQGVCTSLRAKFDSARQAVEGNNTDVAIGELRDALAELEAQHGSEPGKHVSDSGYWLLRINAEYLLKRL